MRASDAVSISGKTQTRLTLSASAAATAALAAGTYQASSDVDCWIRVEPLAATGTTGLTSSTGFPLFAGNGVPVLVPEGFFVAGIAASAGTLVLFPVGGAS
jgi:hypothetical protein